ncbi:MAG TPA: tetratricopeptide repeat protein [Blastocatellia bacterium]|nr:tetratricopeptide repeat protein [Blastocatellia bacterium]
MGKVRKQVRAPSKSQPNAEQSVVKPPRPGRRWSRRDVLVAVALAVATLSVYGQVINHQFISLDDDLYITNNPMIVRGLTLEGIKWAFATFHAANWHPLTWLSHMVDSQLFGLTAGWHLLMNALIHVLNTLLLYYFLSRVTAARFESAIVAALFALHPLHVESVAWAAERKDTLSAFFGLLALIAYARYAESRSWKRYALVALALGLGLMAKPMLVTWPFVLLLLDYWPLGRLRWKPADGIKSLPKALLPLVREKLPLFCIVAASMALTYLAQSRGGAVRALVEEPLSMRVANAIVSYAKYILLTFWPGGLGVYYPFSPSDLSAWKVVASLALLVSITVIAARGATRRPYLIIGWLWFLGTLVPVIGLVQVGGQAMADRYHYVPSIGLFVAIVFAAAVFVRARRIKPSAVTAVAVAALLILGARTWIQVRLWRDSVTLFTHTLSVTSNNLVIQYNLAHVLGRQGRYDEAVSHFAEALAINPDFYDALINMGITLADQGKVAEAIRYYDQALRVEPNSAKARMQMGLALVRQEKTADALPHFYKALELAPNDSDVRTNLGLVMLRQGKLQEAIEQLNEALRLNANSAEAHNNLGLALLAQGKPEEGAAHFSAALRLKPGLAVAQDNLRRAQAQINARQK